MPGRRCLLPGGLWGQEQEGPEAPAAGLGPGEGPNPINTPHKQPPPFPRYLLAGRLSRAPSGRKWSGAGGRRRGAGPGRAGPKITPWEARHGGGRP